MSNLSVSSTSDLAFLSVPKLRDNSSNWSDYKPRIQHALGTKGLWMHVQGKTVMPNPYQIINGAAVLPDGKMKATDEQIEAKEMHIMEYEKCEYLAQHVILSTTSPRIGSIIKNLKTAKEMWGKVKGDATTKSTLFLIDAEDQLATMQVSNSDNPHTHSTKLKQHFKLMTKQHDNLISMGSSISQNMIGNDDYVFTATFIQVSDPNNHSS